MKADSISIQDFFNAERRHLVPLYQRPYVWKRGDQWEPLWDDLRQLAERALAGRVTRPHFLGAIVLDQIKTAIKDVPARLIIDGQQRLTTLQLLTGALRDLCNAIDEHDLGRRLDRLTRNDDAGPASDQRFKVWPTNLDRAPFRELMDASHERSAAQRIEAAHAVAVGDGLVAEAYAYFHETFGAWLREAGEDAVERRAAALIDVLRHGLCLVVIDLGDDDEAQVIFETLNARGAPLLPADLVKNHLFHAAEAEGADLDTLYEKYWKAFDEAGEYWRKLVKQGRFYRPQIDLFLQHYLTLVTRDEVSTAHLFSEFKDFAAKRLEQKAEEHLREIQTYAAVYLHFSQLPQETRRGLFFHRLTVMDTSTLVPFLLGLFKRYGMRTENPDIDAILVDLESFLVRRIVCRLTTKNYNLLFLELLAILDRTESAEAAAGEVRRFLFGQTAESRLWPDDQAFKLAWCDLPAYRVLNRARLRLLLEALDDASRGKYGRDARAMRTLTVEHLLPQAWVDHWPLAPDADPAKAKARRDNHLHRFGNLTLLTRKLNPAVSNGPWTKKRPKITEHSALTLNAWFQRDDNAKNWDEDAIDRRTTELFALALEIWRRPSA